MSQPHATPPYGPPFQILPIVFEFPPTFDIAQIPSPTHTAYKHIDRASRWSYCHMTLMAPSQKCMTVLHWQQREELSLSSSINPSLSARYSVKQGRILNKWHSMMHYLDCTPTHHWSRLQLFSNLVLGQVECAELTMSNVYYQQLEVVNGTGFETHMGYAEGYTWLWVQVWILIPVSFQTNPGSSKTVKNWVSYEQFDCFNQNSLNTWLFWMIQSLFWLENMLGHR